MALLIQTLLVALPLALVPGGAGQADALVGVWDMSTEFQGQQIPATMTVELLDGELVGIWASQGGEMAMVDIVVEGNAISFGRRMGTDGPMLRFEGTLDGDAIEGKFVTEQGELRCTGRRRDS